MLVPEMGMVVLVGNSKCTRNDFSFGLCQVFCIPIVIAVISFAVLFLVVMFLFFLFGSLRTTLCVRFKSEVVACGVVYAAARRFQLPLPENPPWWTIFGAEKAEIDEVCRVLAHLYSLPKAQYIPVCKDSDSFTLCSKAKESQSTIPKVSAWCI